MYIYIFIYIHIHIHMYIHIIYMAIGTWNDLQGFAMTTYNSVKPRGAEARHRVKRSVTVFASTQPLSEVLHPMSLKPRQWMFSEVTSHQNYTTLHRHYFIGLCTEIISTS